LTSIQLCEKTLKETEREAAVQTANFLGYANIWYHVTKAFNFIPRIGVKISST